MRDKVITIYL